MSFDAHDVNQAYNEGVRHERKRILALLLKWLDHEQIDFADIWDDIRVNESRSLEKITIEKLNQFID